MGHQQLYHPSGRIKRSNLRSLLVLALFGQVCGAAFEGYVDFKQAVGACLREVPTGEQCCSSGAANCGSAGTTNMPDWDVSNILDMKIYAFSLWRCFQPRYIFQIISHFHQDLEIKILPPHLSLISPPIVRADEHY